MVMIRPLIRGFPLILKFRFYENCSFPLGVSETCMSDVISRILLFAGFPLRYKRFGFSTCPTSSAEFYNIPGGSCVHSFDINYILENVIVYTPQVCHLMECAATFDLECVLCDVTAEFCCLRVSTVVNARKVTFDFEAIALDLSISYSFIRWFTTCFS